MQQTCNHFVNSLQDYSFKIKSYCNVDKNLWQYDKAFFALILGRGYHQQYSVPPGICSFICQYH